jgi:hypothetical protein
MLIDKLLSMSRVPHPESWSLTLSPLARRAEVAALKLLAQRAEYLGLAERLTLLDANKLVHRVTPEAWPKVGRLLAAGRELRASLDSDFNSLRDGVRDAKSATTASDFESAINIINRDLPRAEGVVERIDRLASEILALVDIVALMQWESPSWVVPPRQDLGAIAVPTGGGSR